MKRIIIGLFLILFVFSNTALAMETVGAKMVKSAQNFGVMSVNKTANEIEKPWIFFNELNKDKNDNQEKIIVYTPYLVTALDAQNKTKSGGLINPQYGLLLAENYQDVLVIGAMLNSKKSLKPDDMKISIKQGNETIQPYYVIVDSIKKDDTTVDKKMSLSNARKYKKEIDETEKNKKYSSREVEILSLSYKPFVEKQKDINLKPEKELKKDENESINIKTKSIVLKKDEKDNSFSKYFKKQQVEKVPKDENDDNKNDELVIVREKTINWQIDFLIYFDINEINKRNKIFLEIKDSYENKRDFKFDLSKVK